MRVRGNAQQCAHVRRVMEAASAHTFHSSESCANMASVSSRAATASSCPVVNVLLLAACASPAESLVPSPLAACAAVVLHVSSQNAAKEEAIPLKRANGALYASRKDVSVM